MASVQIYFVTNRNYIPQNKDSVFGPHFNPDGVAALRFGQATFNVAGGKAALKSIDVYPDAKVMPGQATVPAQGSRNFLDDLRKDMLNGEHDTLIFIHGFNVTFMAALAAGALLADSLPKTINVVVFSWPSDGKAIPYMSYYSDREDARASGPALARAYLKLFDFVKELREEERRRLEAKGADSSEQTELCQQCIHVLAHSMGNYVLRHGIQAIRVKEPGKMVRMFDQVIMAAPDEDDDTFELDDKLRVLPTMARRITVYHNRRDRALVISDKTKANPDRLGSEGPRMLDLLPKKVIIVDCVRIAGPADPLSFHSYYINSTAMGTDITAVLSDEEDDRIGNREVIRVGRAYRITQ
jgi:esterase/lipase superfamily enzyme